MIHLSGIFSEEREKVVIVETKEILEPGQCAYIPHHLVVREEKNSNKVFIDFDAFTKSVWPSFNECLYKCSELIPLIFDILLRFQIFIIAFFSDTKKAFPQIIYYQRKKKTFSQVFMDLPCIFRSA